MSSVVTRRSIVERAGVFVSKRLSRLKVSKFSGTFVITFALRDGGISRVKVSTDEGFVDGVPKE